VPESVGIIVGSGFAGYLGGEPAGVRGTRWGEASAALERVDLGAGSAWVLARHGERQDIPAHAVNYRANLSLLESAGARRIVALNTVGVITRTCAPGELAVPSQVLDYTWGREHTYFTGGAAGLRHIEFTLPFSQALRTELLAAAGLAGVTCHAGGVCAVTQGPRLETAAEIDRLERDGADFVGMTAMPEAALAAELGLDYACLALAVNRAAGRGAGSIHADVDTHTRAARGAALAVLEAFFESRTEAAARS
jgi:5'-methylthioinosine phosphorylase